MSDSEYNQSSRTGSTFTAFLIGGLIGGAIALLYAPRSGQEMREILLDEGDMFNTRLWELSILRLNQLGYFEQLKENDVRARWYAAYSLGQLGPAAVEAAGPLRKILEQEEETQQEYVRATAAWALGRTRRSAVRPPRRTWTASGMC